MSEFKLVYGHGRAQVAFSEAQRSAFTAVLNDIAPRTLQTLDEETDRVFRFARAQAPVKTGTYRDSFERGGRVRPDAVEGFVRNRDPKAWFVRWGPRSPFGFRLGGRVSDDLIFKPAAEGIDRVAVALADDLQALAARGK